MIVTYSESEQERRFTDTGVTDKKNLEEVVAIVKERGQTMIGCGYYSGFIFAMCY